MAKIIRFTSLFFLIYQTSLAADQTLIDRVSVTPKIFNFETEKQAVIKFYLNDSAKIVLKIFDERNELIRIIESKKPLKKGQQQISWDGKNGKGEHVVSGVYAYVLEAQENPDQNFDLRSQTGGEEVFVEGLYWDREKQKILFNLPRAAYVRLRIGLKEAIFLGTLQDWMPMEAGKKEMDWDGHDPDYVFNLNQHENAQINVSAFALPDNTVIVRNSKSHLEESHSSFEEIVAKKDASLFLRQDRNQLYLHTRHPFDLCHEPEFNLEFPQTEIDPEGAYVIRDKQPLRIILSPEDKDYLIANRFEAMFFIDGVFLFEQEEATSPINIQLPLPGISPGRHQLTINIMDYEDHIGVRTVTVVILPQS